MLRARPHCCFAPPPAHFVPYALTYSAPRLLRRQRDRPLGLLCCALGLLALLSFDEFCKVRARPKHTVPPYNMTIDTVYLHSVCSAAPSAACCLAGRGTVPSCGVLCAARYVATVWSGHSALGELRGLAKLSRTRSLPRVLTADRGAGLTADC
jgi:hypothetical protein